MPVIQLCNAECDFCHREFPYPSLGDFSYGEFIVHRDDGRDFRYLNALQSEVCEWVRARVNSPAIFREIIARLADAPAAHFFTMEMVCPHCGSRRFRDWAGKLVTYLEIQNASFDSFLALDTKGKEALLEKVERSLRAE